MFEGKGWRLCIGGSREGRPLDPIFSLSCSFRQKSCQKIGFCQKLSRWHPPPVWEILDAPLPWTYSHTPPVKVHRVQLVMSKKITGRSIVSWCWLPPTSIVCGNVMFSVMSVCSQGWSSRREVQVNKIEQQEPVVRGGGLHICSPNMYWQAGGWPSTEGFFVVITWFWCIEISF